MHQQWHCSSVALSYQNYTSTHVMMYSVQCSRSTPKRHPSSCPQALRCLLCIVWRRFSVISYNRTTLYWYHETLCSECFYNLLPFSVFAQIYSLLLNSLWPSDAIWQQRSGSTLAQVKACCLTAPSHYLNQCWLIISEVQWHSYQGNFTTGASTINH